jgi:hypothetical protein
MTEAHQASSEAGEAPPKELIVDAKPAPGDSSDGSGGAVAPIAISFAAAGLLAKLVAPWAGLVAVVVAAIVLYLRRPPQKGRFVLRVVHEKQLEIRREKESSPLSTIPLDEILSINLDTQTKAGGRGGSSQVERARLALERRSPADPIYVPEDHVTPLEAQEWLAKVRTFLRKNDWLPEDEREPPSF